jgi:hypothetical protein
MFKKKVIVLFIVVTYNIISYTKPETDASSLYASNNEINQAFEHIDLANQSLVQFSTIGKAHMLHFFPSTNQIKLVFMGIAEPQKTHSSTQPLSVREIKYPHEFINMIPIKLLKFEQPNAIRIDEIYHDKHNTWLEKLFKMINIYPEEKTYKGTVLIDEYKAGIPLRIVVKSINQLKAILTYFTLKLGQDGYHINDIKPEHRPLLQLICTESLDKMDEQGQGILKKLFIVANPKHQTVRTFFEQKIAQYIEDFEKIKKETFINDTIAQTIKESIDANVKKIIITTAILFMLVKIYDTFMDSLKASRRLDLEEMNLRLALFKGGFSLHDYINSYPQGSERQYLKKLVISNKALDKAFEQQAGGSPIPPIVPRYDSQQRRNSITGTPPIIVTPPLPEQKYQLQGQRYDTPPKRRNSITGTPPVAGVVGVVVTPTPITTTPPPHHQQLSGKPPLSPEPNRSPLGKHSSLPATGLPPIVAENLRQSFHTPTSPERSFSPETQDSVRRTPSPSPTPPLVPVNLGTRLPVDPLSFHVAHSISSPPIALSDALPVSASPTEPSPSSTTSPSPLAQ